ncbi:MAG: homoserine kinase [Actinomycetota bacterium]|nr:homoserine kinase [Actinomycetota bacterium]
MSFVSGPVTIRVPASSANLGPGFDALGLALSLYDEITVEVVGDALVVDVEGEAAAEVPRNERNLVVESMRRAFKELGEEPPGLRVSCLNVIPHGRGLGSSAAAIVGGIVAARALVEGGRDRLGDNEILRLANDIEGHPDNVAAALFGGLTIAWTAGGVGKAVRLDALTEAAVFIPPVSVSTHTARGVLPAKVSHGDAAANAGRAALLVAALVGGRSDVLLAATEDRLHQDYRASEMPASHEFMSALRAEGIPAIISGAGPTVLAFSNGRDLSAHTPSGWAYLDLTVDSQGTILKP